MEIRNWLNGDRDYETGRLLYARLGRNEALQRLFALGPSVYNTRKLASELEALQEPEPKPVAPEEPRAGHRDAALQVWEQLVPLLDEQRALHTELSVLATSAARLKNAQRIMHLAARLSPLWETYHYAKAHGKLPETAPNNPVPEKEADQLRRLQNLRTYRTRYQNRPDKLPGILAEIKLIEEALHHGKTK